MIMIKNLTALVNYDKMKIRAELNQMLTATISHDMRTPLNAIIGMTRSLTPSVHDPSGHKFLKIIMNSSQILLFLVNDLLDLFKIKNDKFSKNEQRCVIKEVILEALDLFTI